MKKSKSRQSEFAQWFELQFGPEPVMNMTICQLNRIATNAGAEARQVYVDLEKKRLWHAQRTAALYAWQARESWPKRG